MERIIKKDLLPDWGARYGGEEFFVCFVGVNLPTGKTILERIRQHIEENLIVTDDGQCIAVTVSVGLAELRPGENMDGLIERCDALLYQAKRTGKNRIEISAEQLASVPTRSPVLV